MPIPPALRRRGADRLEVAGVVGARVDHHAGLGPVEVGVRPLQRHRPRVRGDDPSDLRMTRRDSPRVLAEAGCTAARSTAAGDLFGDRLAGVLGLEHDGVAGAAEDLAHQPVGRRRRAARRRRRRRRAPRPRCAPRAAQRARSGETQTRATLRRSATSPCAASPRPRPAPRPRGAARSARSETVGLLDPVEPEVADAVAGRGRSSATYQPSRPFVERVGLDRALGELVLVLLVVLELEHAAGRRSPR